jgi:hypothetical protein
MLFCKLMYGLQKLIASLQGMMESKMKDHAKISNILWTHWKVETWPTKENAPLALWRNTMRPL